MTNIISTGIPPTGLGISDEFESSTLNAQWTESTVGTTTRDIHTSWPSNYYWKGDGLADQSRTLECNLTSSAGNALSVTACFRLPGLEHNYSQMTGGIYLATNGSYTDYVALALTSGRAFRLQQMIASTPTNFGTYNLLGATSMYFHLQRTAGNVWTAWYSTDGFAWINPIATASQLTLSQSVAKLKLTLRDNASGVPTQSGWDWVRQGWLTL